MNLSRKDNTMKKNLIAVAVIASAFAVPLGFSGAAVADTNAVTDAKSCAEQVKDVKDAQKEGTDVGEKDAKVLAQITEVIESLCGRKNWKDASSLLEVARTMMATEE